MLTLEVIAAGAIAVLGWELSRRFASDRFQRFADGRRGSSRLVSRGKFVDGNRHLPVSLALSETALYYENSDIRASLNLEWLQEVAYENELITGKYVGQGNVLRLRCFGQVFEFLLPKNMLPQWKAALPAHYQAASRHEPDKISLDRADDDHWAAGAVAGS